MDKMIGLFLGVPFIIMTAIAWTGYGIGADGAANEWVQAGNEMTIDKLLIFTRGSYEP